MLTVFLVNVFQALTGLRSTLYALRFTLYVLRFMFYALQDKGAIQKKPLLVSISDIHLLYYLCTYNLLSY